MNRGLLAAACAAALCAGAAHAQGFVPPKVDDDATTHVPAFDMPFSGLASAEAKANFVASQRAPVPVAVLPPTTPISEIRRVMDQQFFGPLVAKQYAAFPVTMEVQTIGGVYTQVFTPKDGVAPKNAHRVLVDLHGGGFIIGSRSESQIESVPLAGTAKIKVISVDYRMGPEFHFPAASEDVAAVYRELLKTYKPSEIIIYGCSAGGFLTGESMAWFQKQGLPNPAAIGIFCAHTQAKQGDSDYVTGRLGGTIPPPPFPPPPPGTPKPDPYFNGADRNDPLVSPSASTAVLARFPPTLLVVGSRDAEASGATRTHIDLVKAGVDARLFVWDGMDHGFWGNPDLPESREAYRVMVNFFEEQFDRAAR